MTHAFGMDQREVGLAFTAGSGSLTVTAPPNGNIAPPGYYMLFILNNSGVPSVSTFVQVTAGAGQQQAMAMATQFAATAAPSTAAGLVQGQTIARTDHPAASPNAISPARANMPVDEGSQATRVTEAMARAGLAFQGIWSGKFISREPGAAPFDMKLVIQRDSHGQLSGTSTLTSKCLQHAHVQVTVVGSNFVLSGNDEAGDNITVRGTLDRAGKVLNSTYILDGSATGRCETDTGTGTLSRQ